MATSNNDRISSAKLATFAAKLWAKIKSTFAAKSHSHQISDVSQLSSALDNKLFASASNATSDTLWNLSAAGDEVTNVFDNTRLLATGVNAAGGFSFLRFSTLRDKIKTYLGFSATTGKLADANIESASTWNNKMNASGSNATADGIGNIIQKADFYTASDFPTDKGDPQIGVLFRDSSGDVNYSGRINLENFEILLKSDIGAWPSAKELYKSDRGNVWFMSCGKNQVYRLTMPANKDCGLASLFVHTTAANGWPLIFQVGWRWGGSSFSAVPHLAYIYTTSQSSEDKMVTVKYSGECLYICINQTQTQRRALFSLISDNVDSIEFDVISQTLSDYTQATAVAAGNTEGCVMKSKIGTSIGNTSKPVYVSNSGFVQQCDSVEADTWDGYHLSVIQNYGEVSLDSNVITFLRT